MFQILNEQIKKQEEEDERKKQEINKKQMNERLKDLLIKEKEREIAESLWRKEMVAQKEREMVFFLS